MEICIGRCLPGKLDSQFEAEHLSVDSMITVNFYQRDNAKKLFCVLLFVLLAKPEDS